MEIKIDDLTGPEIAQFLQDHLDDMATHTPPESRHALDLDGLRRPEITFWSIWEGGNLVGSGALKELDPANGEIKSMRTSPNHRRKGVGRAMLQHIINEAKQRNYTCLYLETGSVAAFIPAQKMYQRMGFEYCDPFGDYVKDENNVFMKMVL